MVHTECSHDGNMLFVNALGFRDRWALRESAGQRSRAVTLIQTYEQCWSSAVSATARRANQLIESCLKSMSKPRLTKIHNLFPRQ